MREIENLTLDLSTPLNVTRIEVNFLNGVVCRSSFAWSINFFYFQCLINNFAFYLLHIPFRICEENLALHQYNTL